MLQFLIVFNDGSGFSGGFDDIIPFRRLDIIFIAWFQSASSQKEDLFPRQPP